MDYLARMSMLPTENVQDYPRPPRLEPVPHRVVVRLGGRTVAETTRALRVLETHHAPTYYLPPEDVQARLEPASGSSFCEWKGRARYFDVSVEGTMAGRAAWSYETPSTAFVDLGGYLAFYPGLMEACFVGEEKVIPQPGDFYGGWVTSNLTGRVKGARGTEHW